LQAVENGAKERRVLDLRHDCDGSRPPAWLSTNGNKDFRNILDEDLGLRRKKPVRRRGEGSRPSIHRQRRAGPPTSCTPMHG
jgi:hypothetical protein